MLLLFSCSGREQRGLAHIIQRRQLPGNRLMLSYRFPAGNLIIYDSLELPNKVLQHDSVPVIFSVQNPGRHRLLLP